MALSGTYTFSVTLADIIRECMLNLGRLAESENPSAQEITDLTRKLNMLVKQWQAKADFAPGLKVWTRLRGNMFLSSTTGNYQIGSSSGQWGDPVYNRTTTATYNAGATAIAVSASTNFTSGDNVGIELDSGVLFWTTATISGTTLTLTTGLPSKSTSGAVVFNYTTNQIRPERIETCVLRDINYNDTPINIMTLQDYQILPTKSSSTYIADPQGIYYEYGINATNYGTIYTDVGAAADTTKWLHIVFLSPIMDFTNQTDNPFFPQAWFLPLTWGLAKQSASMFGVQWTDQMQSNYIESLAIAREQFPETTSMYFMPGDDEGYPPNILRTV